MPLEGAHEGDVGFESADGLVCSFDSKDGVIKGGEEIFEGGVQFFLGEVAGPSTGSGSSSDRALAERLTRKNMRSLPYWQAHSFAELDGELATDAEFGEAMAKL